MHHDTIAAFSHDHVFLGAEHERNERRTWGVIALCGVMMAAEIGGGILFGSMALIADGLHMSTHTAALLIAALAYSFARRHARDERFAFGTGKFGDLASFSSAIVLAMIALLIGWESVTRLLQPVPIAFNEAIPIAALGLGVNLLSAWLLRDNPGHHHAHAGEGDHHSHAHHHHHADHIGAHHADLNLRAAYVHVLADAAVSVLAVVGLLAAREFGLVWIDPLMGIVGAGVIANWSFGLIKAAGAVLLDMRAPELTAAVRERLEVNGDRVADLHLWRVGPGHMAAVVSVVSDGPQPPASYKARLAGLTGLSHVTVEVQPCPGHHQTDM
jgi:cation diffusion facilitator family transporter